MGIGAEIVEASKKHQEEIDNWGRRGREKKVQTALKTLRSSKKYANATKEKKEEMESEVEENQMAEFDRVKPQTLFQLLRPLH